MSPEQKPQDKPKIIVDNDWKAQAQAEKERLSRDVEEKQEAGAVAAPGAAAPGAAQRGRRRERQQLPPASFVVLVNSLATQAALALGGLEDPRTGHRLVDLDLAKHHIDLLSVLEEKTKGNLTEEERKVFDETLYQVRMLFVEISQRVGGPLGQGT